MGVASYDCYTNSNTNEVSGYATYNGSFDMPSVTSQSNNGFRSKVWSNSSNDCSFGTCSVNSNCRTEAETSNMATCLSQASSNDYTMNYRCYGTSGSNNTITKVDNSNYRKQYELGSFDSTSNQWSTGSCKNASSNYLECRTQPDVDAEVAWKTSNNWQCYNYNIGRVEATTDWNKNYQMIADFNNISESNQGICTSSTASNCRKQEDVIAQSNCLNSNQYHCWESTYTVLPSNVLRQFTQTTDKNKNYTPQYTNTTDTGYVTQSNFDSNCTTSNCISYYNALNSVNVVCSNDRSTCYKEGTASSNQFGDEVSWSIVYDSNALFGHYSTRVVDDGSNIKCVRRDNCDTQSNVCESKSNTCYIQPTYNSNNSNNFFDMSSNTYQTSRFDDGTSNCVAPSTCTTLPYCSYMTVDTSSGSNFDWNQIDQNDCSEPANGKRYRWTLESSTIGSVSNPSSNVSTSNAWIQVN